MWFITSIYGAFWFINQLLSSAGNINVQNYSYLERKEYYFSQQSLRRRWCIGKLFSMLTESWYICSK